MLKNKKYFKNFEEKLSKVCGYLKTRIGKLWHAGHWVTHVSFEMNIIHKKKLQNINMKWTFEEYMAKKSGNIQKLQYCYKIFITKLQYQTCLTNAAIRRKKTSQKLASNHFLWHIHLAFAFCPSKVDLNYCYNLAVILLVHYHKNSDAVK